MEKQLEKEYLPLLQYVMILSEKGVPTTVESVACGMAIGSIDVKRDNNGNWFVAKHEMERRIREKGKKWAKVEAGHYSLSGFIYELSKCGIDMEEGQLSNLIILGKLDYKIDKYGRHLIPAHELEKRVKLYGVNN
jgi:hypothetical protein